MTRLSIFVIFVAALALAIAGPVRAADPTFEKLAAYFERNIEDKDAEIRFEVTGGADGLSSLRILAPDGRVVVELRTPGSKLGVRSFVLESPEFADDGRLRADFPQGRYKFEGTTTAGAELRGEVALSHIFPEPASLSFPKEGQADVPTSNVTLRWNAPSGVTGCVVVLEQTGTAFEVRAHLPGDARSFAVPAGFLRPGTAYKVAIGTISRAGSRSFVETEFKTKAGP